MAQRKSPASRGPGAGKSSGPSSTPGSRPAGTKPTGAKPTGTKPTGASASTSGKAGTSSKATGAAPAGKPSGAGRPPNRKPGKSIVNQKQTPWGLIWTTIVIVAFAVAVVVAVIVTRRDSTTPSTSSAGGQKVDRSDPYRQPESPAAQAIKGVTYRVEGEHNHVTGAVKYDSSPPVGGNHSVYWADCAGTVYPKAIANENAVHMLEHGAVWITYNPKTLSASGLTELTRYVAGVDRLALSPYPNLKTPISLQAWGYQLFVSSPSDARIPRFISALKSNQKVTPEYGATCSQPTFKQKPSTFGHPSER